MKSNMKKNFFWNTLGSGLAAFNSLLFMIIVTRINGSKIAGIFTLCYATACLMFIVALYCGRTYQVTETDDKITDSEYIINRIISCVFAILCTFVFGIINGYSGIKFYVLILLCLLRILEAFSDVFHGIFQKNSRLDLVGKSLTIRSLLNVFLFFIVDYLTNNIILSCLSMVIINILVLFLFDILFSKKYISIEHKIEHINVKKIFILGFFTFGFTFLSNFLINIPRYSIDMFLDEKYQTIFGIIVMPGTFIILISQFIIQPFIMHLKKYRDLGETKKYNSLVYRIIVSILIIGLLFVLGAYFFGIRILEFMYGFHLEKYLFSLIITIIGTILYTISVVLSNSLIVLRKTKIQLFIFSLVSLVGFLISRLLVKMYSFNGGVYSYLFIMIFLVSLYIIYYFYIVKIKKIIYKK